MRTKVENLRAKVFTAQENLDKAIIDRANIEPKRHTLQVLTNELMLAEMEEEE